MTDGNTEIRQEKIDEDASDYKFTLLFQDYCPYCKSTSNNIMGKDSKPAHQCKGTIKVINQIAEEYEK